MITIKRLEPTDWALLKDVRLRALADAPYAFTATYEDAAKLTDEDWSNRAKLYTQTIAVIAFEDDIPCGLASCYFPDGPDKAYLAMMWVAPEYRKHGVGKAVVDYISEWALQQGFTALYAAVTVINAHALRFYHSLGFQNITESEIILDPDEIVLKRDLIAQ